MYCDRCGAEVRENAHFCLECGADVSQMKEIAESQIISRKQQKNPPRKEKKIIIKSVVISAIALTVITASALVFFQFTDTGKLMRAKNYMEDKDYHSAYELVYDCSSEKGWAYSDYYKLLCDVSDILATNDVQQYKTIFDVIAESGVQPSELYSEADNQKIQSLLNASNAFSEVSMDYTNFKTDLNFVPDMMETFAILDSEYGAYVDVNRLSSLSSEWDKKFYDAITIYNKYSDEMFHGQEPIARALKDLSTKVMNLTFGGSAPTLKAITETGKLYTKYKSELSGYDNSIAANKVYCYIMKSIFNFL